MDAAGEVLGVPLGGVGGILPRAYDSRAAAGSAAYRLFETERVAADRLWTCVCQQFFAQLPASAPVVDVRFVNWLEAGQACQLLALPVCVTLEPEKTGSE